MNLAGYGMTPCGFKGCSPCEMDDYEAREMIVVSEYLFWKFGHGKMSYESLDIGAHVGLWSAFLASEYHKFLGGTVYALEPEPQNFKVLKANAELFVTKDIGIIPQMFAAWNKTTSLVIQKQINPGRHYVTDSVMRGRDVPICTGVAIDDITTKDGASKRLDFIKIDVEGAELNVMNGMRQTIEQQSNVLVLVEYSLDHFDRYGYNVTAINSFMKAIGLQFARSEDEQSATTIRGGQIKKIFFTKGDSPWKN